MKILKSFFKFLKKYYSKSDLEKAKELNLITEEDFLILKIQRTEKKLKELENKLKKSQV